MHDKAKFYIVALSLLLLTLPLVMAEVSFDDVTFSNINNSRPEIQVEYDLRDAPIDIVDYNLINRHGVEVPLDMRPNDKLNKFNFTINETGSLFGKYVFQIVAKDKDGNTNIDYHGLDVQKNPMDIWVEQPRNNDISNPKDQHMAVDEAVPFDLTLRSDSPAQCRILKNNGFIEQSTQSQLFNSGKRFNNASSSFTTQHTIPVVSMSHQASSTRLKVAPFDYDNHAQENQYLVICKEYKIGSDEPDYKQQLFHIGYDSTPPEFTVDFDPSQIFDEASIKSTATITSKEDHLICSYDFVNNTEPKYRPETHDLFSQTTSISDYNANMSTTFDFSDKGTYNFDKTYPYKIRFTCTNPAGHVASQTEELNIRLQLSFDIKYEDNGFYNSNDPTLHFTTPKMASCRYKFQSEDYEDTDESEHTHNVTLDNLDEGNYTIQLRCNSVGGDQEEDAFDFTIDKTPPETPAMLSDEYNCNPRWTIDIDTPSETVYYNISLHNQTPTSNETELYHTLTSYTSSPSTYQASPDIPVKENTTYTWIVTAIDRGGLASNTAEHDVTGVSSQDIVCDTDYPQATLERDPVDQGFNVSISCEDGQSGCTGSYGYQQVGPSGNCSQVSYEINSYNTTMTIPPETLLCYQVRDKAGHTTNESELFTSDIEINITKPSSQLATQKIFPFQATTKREATCKHGPVVEGHPEEQGQWYEQLDNLSSETGTAHETSIAATDYEQLDENEAESEAKWVVVCKESNSTYHLKEFTLGYDTSPAELSLVAEPNPITTPGTYTTTLKLSSDDDVICTFLDKEGVPRGFEEYDPGKEESYKQSFQTTIDYWGVQEDIVQNVKCRNRAGRVSEATTTITIEPENELGITIETGQFQSDNRFELIATTQQDANCQYKKSRDSSLADMAVTGKKNHSTFVTLNDGDHTFEIHCMDRNAESAVFKTITVDTTKPTLDIIAAEKTCSLEQLQFALLGNGTGTPITEYAYTITSQNTTLLQGKSQTPKIEESIEMEQDETYTIKATAVDAAGNDETKTTSVIATPQTQSCDTTPPQGDATTSYKWEYNEVSVSCTDDQSGCTDQFMQEIASEDCRDEYGAISYDSLPSRVSIPSTYCYEIYDQAANSYSDSLDVTFHPQCFNGIEDPDEKGIDCGGPCPAMCGTCDNGKQDPFEMGIDCGGVCSWKEDCVEETEKDVECESDDECGEGEKCSALGECVERRDRSQDDDFTIEESSTPLGLILLIAGILLFLGGAGYIVYSRHEKYQQQQQQQQVISQQMRQRQQQEMARKQAQERKRRMEELKRRQQAQEQARSSKVKEREQHRKSLIGEFENETTEQAQDQQDRESETPQEENEKEQPDRERTEEIDKQEQELADDVIKKHEQEANEQTLKERNEQQKQQDAKEEYRSIRELEAKKDQKTSSAFDELDTIDSTPEQTPSNKSSSQHETTMQNKEQQSQTPSQATGQTQPSQPHTDTSSSPSAKTETATSTSALDELDEIIGSNTAGLSKEFEELIAGQDQTDRVDSITTFIEQKTQDKTLGTEHLEGMLDQLRSQELIDNTQQEEIIKQLEAKDTITEDQAKQLSRDRR